MDGRHIFCSLRPWPALIHPTGTDCAIIASQPATGVRSLCGKTTTDVTRMPPRAGILSVSSRRAADESQARCAEVHRTKTSEQEGRSQVYPRRSIAVAAIVLLTVLATTSSPRAQAGGAASLTALDAAYNENFSALAAAGTSAVLPSG
jgi:hypothetical protein